MGDDASRFRGRARHCRELAKDARDDQARQTLNHIADELDAEAAEIDAQNAAAAKIIIEPNPSE